MYKRILGRLPYRIHSLTPWVIPSRPAVLAELLIVVLVATRHTSISQGPSANTSPIDQDVAHRLYIRPGKADGVRVQLKPGLGCRTCAYQREETPP